MEALELRSMFGARVSEADSFDQMLRLCERPILRLCYRLLGNLDDAEDAAQEVFLKAWNNRGRIMRDRDPSPWLYRIAVNTCRDHFRRQRPDREIADTDGDGGVDPETSAQREEQERIVMEGLRQLGDRERMALVLRHLEGMETAEVAALMGVSEATVRSQSAQARAKLKAWVESRGVR
ncbi:MAG: sigma-70 family RNA polymerase sigma factor [Bryobacteraceae bacterium]